MDEVGGGLENESEDQILDRALEESLRYYKEVELPRLSQTTRNPEVTQRECVDEEIGGLDDWDCWQEWDAEQVESAIKIEESLINGVNFKEENPSVKKQSVENKHGSSELMKNYLYREVVPKQRNVSVGEVGHDGADGFDKEAGRLWIYPCGYPVRKYQLDIVHSALFDNTLVSLPTGLGKTFIAAVVMYNFYRWFPMGKIIFLAPTRPLVAQQIHACYNIMGIPKEDTLELTGSKSATERAKAWKEKRVFFATPQVAANDLGTGACPGELVRCIIVDEAHRAAGNHAICQAIRGLLRLREQSPGSRFRILALSATPGRNIPSVANVVETLRISKLELRDEQSPDVAPHTHQRNAETVVVPLGPKLSQTRDRFLMIMDPYVDRLMNRKLLYCGQKYKLNKFQILQARANFRSNPPPGMDYSQKGLIEGDFAICITLTHALGLLLTHGQRTFMSFIQGILDGDRGSAVVRGRLAKNILLLSLLSDLKDSLGAANSMHQPAPDVSLSEGMAEATAVKNIDNPFITSHPKMDHLKEIVVEHFERHQRNGESTRVMIFCEYRDPVVELCNMLMRHWPLVKPMSFVGQASSSAHADPNVAGPSIRTKGFTQKQQLQAVRGFRDGGYNVLVSTCVGEEGLDIGEVDLIVCYDAPHSSPLRLVQRMGRTGRKREGRVVTLVTQDWEEQKHKMGLHQKNTIVKSLMTSKALAAALCRGSARVLPPGTDPKCHMMPMVIPKCNEEDEKKVKKGKGKTGKTKRLQEMTKKYKRKTKVKTLGGVCSDDEANEGLEDKNGGKEGDDVDHEETARSMSKGKGKRKTRKKNVKAIPYKKAEKGIPELFSMQKAKVFDPVIELEEEFEDDDFIGDNKQNKKAHSASDEVILIDEDVNCVFEAPISKEFEVEDSVSNPNFILPPDLLTLENAMASIIGNYCCPCSKSDSPYNCSIIASHFQLGHSSCNPPFINAVMSLEFLTAEVILNFDAAVEAEKVGPWKPDSLVKTVERSLWAKKVNLPTEEYHQDWCLTPAFTRLTSDKEEPFKKRIMSNETTYVPRKEVIDVDNKEVIDITHEYLEDKLTTPKSQFKNKNKNMLEIDDISNCLPSHSKEGLLWNVLGKTSQREIVDVDEFGDDDVNNKNDKMENFNSVSINTVLTKKMSSLVDMGAYESNSIYDCPEKTPTKQTVQTSSALNPVACSSKSMLKNNSKMLSPDIIEDRYTHGSQEKTPNKLSVQPVLTFKASPHVSPTGTKHKQAMLMASSTPKVHRRSLFHPIVCLPSPIANSTKKAANANFNLLPPDMDFSDHSLFSPSGLKTPSPKKQIVSPSKIRTLSPSSSVEIVEQLENEIHSYELPNFDLGWEDLFNSEASDDTTFVELENCNENNDTDTVDDFCITLEENHKVSSLKDTKKFMANPSVEEKGEESSKAYAEKSNDIFCNITSETVLCSTFQGKLLKGKTESHLGNPFGSWSNQSLTVTQMVDLLACPENPSKDRKSQDLESNVRERGNETPQLIGNSKSNSLIPCYTKYDKCDCIDQSAKGVPAIKNSKIGADVTDVSVKEIINGNLETNHRKGDSSKKRKRELVIEEMNFDLGDEAFLDISADLFAEDVAEIVGSEKGKEEAQVADKMHLKEVVSASEQSEVTLVCSREKEVKNTENEEWKINQLNRKNDIGTADENFVKEPKNIFLPVAPTGLVGWKSNCWLSKATPPVKNKLRLGHKDNKKQVESDGRSKNIRQFLCNDNISKDNGNNITGWTGKSELNSNPHNLGQKVSKGDSWIDEITSKRTILTSIVHTDPQINTLSENPDETKMICDDQSVQKTSIRRSSNISSTSSEFKDDVISGHDIEKKLVEHSFRKCSQSYTKPGKLDEQKLTDPEPEEISLNVKDSKASSKNRNKPASKQEDVFDIITLSSDSYEESGDDFGDVKHHMKSSIDIERSKMIEEEDGNELNEAWSEWEDFEGDKHKEFMDSESSDDFENLGVKRGQNSTPAACNPKEISISSEEKPPVRLRRARRQRRCEFLETQAEESFIKTRCARKLSSDEDDDDKGQSQYYDPSFINDGLPNSQEGEIDMHAKYLQSVRSPRNAKFKMSRLPLLYSERENYPASPDAYAPDPSDSCYMNDSFCVDAESEGSDNKERAEDTVDELEVLEAILAKNAKEKKSQKRKKNVSSDDEVEILEVKYAKKQKKSEIKGNKQKRKRIVVHDSSEEEEDQPKDPSAKKMRIGIGNETEIGTRLIGAMSQGYDEQTTQIVKGVCLSSNEKNNRILFEGNENANIANEKNSSDSRAFIEKKTHKLSADNFRKEHRFSDEISCRNFPSDNSGLASNKGQKDSPSNHCNKSKGDYERKAIPDLVNEMARNWSADLFDSWDLSDDEKPPGVTEMTPSAGSWSPNPSLDSSSRALPTAIVSGVTNKQDKTSVVTAPFKSGPSDGGSNSSHAKTNSCLAGGNHIQGKNLPSTLITEPTCSSFIPHASRRQIVGKSTLSLQKPQDVLHSDAKKQDESACLTTTSKVAFSSSSLGLPSTSSAVPLQHAPMSTNSGYPKEPVDMETLIVVSPVEACRASEVVSALRMNGGVRVVVYAPVGSTSIPYALGRNLCLVRSSISDLGRGSKISDAVIAAHGLYSKVSVIVEWGNEDLTGGAQKNPWAQKKSSNAWNSSSVPTSLSPSAKMALLNFRDAGIIVLHSAGRVETAKLIAELARHNQKLELKLGMQPIDLPKSFKTSDPKLKFYASLPGVNPIQALYILQQFPKISSFLDKCSSARSIQAATGLDLNKALQLHKVLANVHISDS